MINKEKHIKKEKRRAYHSGFSHILREDLPRPSSLLWLPWSLTCYRVLLHHGCLLFPNTSLFTASLPPVEHKLQGIRLCSSLDLRDLGM